MIRIRILKFCGELLLSPSELILSSGIESEKFPSDWKKADIVPVHKIGDKQVLKNYRPISLLTIFSKIFERLTLYFVRISSGCVLISL